MCTLELTSSYNWTFDIPFHTGETTVTLEAKAQLRRCWNKSNSTFLEDFDPWETDGPLWVGIMVVFEPPFLLITMKHLYGRTSCPSLQRARALLSSFSSVFGLLKVAEAELQQSSLELWSLGTMDSLCI